MKILITGAKGMLGSLLAAKLQVAGHQVRGVDLPEYDLTDPAQVQAIFKGQQYDFVFNCAAFTNVNLCETEYEKAYAVNALAVKYLAAAAGTSPFLHVSTDYVFNGRNTKPYEVDQPLEPVSAYGKTKAFGERFLQESGHKKYFIVRTAWLYGPNGKNFVDTIIKLAGEKDELKVVEDQRGSPTYSNDLAEVLLNFLYCKNYGIYHFTNSGETTWYDFAREILKLAGLQTPVLACSTADYPTPAKRPAYSVLSLNKIVQEFKITIPDWQDALRRYLLSKKQ